MITYELQCLTEYSSKEGEPAFRLAFFCCQDKAFHAPLFYTFSLNGEVEHGYCQFFNNPNEDKFLKLDDIETIVCQLCHENILTKEIITNYLAVYNLSGETGVYKYLTSLNFQRIN